MTNVNYSPIVKSLLDSVYNGYLEKDSAVNNKKVEHEIFESEKDYLIRLFVPGYQKTDFEIKVEKNQLIVSALKENETPQDYKLLSKTTKDGKIYKIFTLSDNIDTDKIGANYENGVLTFVVTKKENNNHTRKIEIQ